MASAAGPIDRVTFEVSFQENHRIGRNEGLHPINIHFDGCKKDIQVRVDRAFRDGSEHRLVIHTRVKDAPSETSWNENRYIRVSLEMVSSLSLSKKVIRWGGGVLKLADAATHRPQMEDNDIPIEATTVAGGKTYRIQLVNEVTGLVARIVEVIAEAAPRQNAAAPTEFRTRVHNMGAALVEEGMQNLGLAAEGGAPIFNPSSTNADVFAHAIRGVVRAGQKMHPDIQVPHARPSEQPSDLNELSIAELQNRFEKAYTQDKLFETQRMQAALSGNMTRLNELMNDEMANSQLVVMLAEALERKGVRPQIPQDNKFQTHAQQSQNAHLEGLQDIQNACNQQ